MEGYQTLKAPKKQHQNFIILEPEFVRGKEAEAAAIKIRAVRDKSGDMLVVTTCHPVQIVKEVPAGNQDEKIDIIVTPEEVYYVRR